MKKETKEKTMTCKINNDQRHHPAEKQPTTCRKKPRARVPAFPQQLYAMVDHAERCGYSHIVSWHPDGRAFQIRDEQALVKTILVQYFNKQTRYKSFLRQLQLYGFTRTYKGPQRGLFQHPLFQRGRHELLDGKVLEDFRTLKKSSTDLNKNKNNNSNINNEGVVVASLSCDIHGNNIDNNSKDTAAQGSPLFNAKKEKKNSIKTKKPTIKKNKEGMSKTKKPTVKKNKKVMNKIKKPTAKKNKKVMNETKTPTTMTIETNKNKNSTTHVNISSNDIAAVILTPDTSPKKLQNRVLQKDDSITDVIDEYHTSWSDDAADATLDDNDDASSISLWWCDFDRKIDEIKCGQQDSLNENDDASIGTINYYPTNGINSSVQGGRGMRRTMVDQAQEAHAYQLLGWQLDQRVLALRREEEDLQRLEQQQRDYFVRQQQHRFLQRQKLDQLRQQLLRHTLLPGGTGGLAGGHGIFSGSGIVQDKAEYRNIQVPHEIMIKSHSDPRAGFSGGLPWL